MTLELPVARGPARYALAALAILLVATSPPREAGAQLVRSGSGIGTPGATAARDLFRLDLGGGLVAGANGSFGGLRREINWDGTPANFSAPNNLPVDFFNVNSPRGVVFSTPGGGFQVSGANTDAGVGQPAAADFGNLNPSYSATFEPFSSQRLFTALTSTITDVRFFVPGTNTAALTRGFGSIFSDVDLANTTSIQFFDALDNSMGTFFAPNVVGATAPSFSFLGVSFATPVVSRVRITSGNHILDNVTNDQNGNTVDLVVMDDFLYAEPFTTVPEPATFGLLAAGLAAVGLVARYRSRG